MNQRFSNSLNPEQAFAKAKHYCAYQERSHIEVKEKLYSFKLKKVEVEELLSRLIEEGYLNEERFAKLFVGGKFRLKKWGRVKIMYELKQKRISPYNIKKAMQEIDENEYRAALEKVISGKWNLLKNEQHLIRQYKTQQYALQKGYEPSLIQQVLSELRKNSK
jgi:regulatory protein